MMHTLHTGVGAGATAVDRSSDGGRERDSGTRLLRPAEIPADLGRRLAVCVALTIPLVIIAIATLVRPAALPAIRLPWLQLALATPVVVYGGLPLFRGALGSLRSRRSDMLTLVSLGTLTAYGYSLVATLAPWVLPHQALSRHGTPELYFGAAACTVTLVLTGEALERFALRRTLEAVGDERTVARALSPRPDAPMQELTDRVSAALVPLVLAVASISFVGWLAFGPEPRVAHAVASAVAVLVIACPAALGLAAPMATAVATGVGAKKGILVRDADSLETLAAVTTLVVDGRGILTEGRPRVHTVEPAPGVDRRELLRLAGSAEFDSEHPVGRALVEQALSEQTFEPDIVPQSVRRTVQGRGVLADVEGRSIVLGTQALLAGRGVIVPEPALHRAEELREDGASVSFAAIDGRYAGLVALDDPARPAAKDAIADLRKMGVRVAMLTGDTRTTGRHVARELDLHEAEVFAQIRPDDRARTVDMLVQRGETVAVAAKTRHTGAGAFTAAHVGIALGSGADGGTDGAHLVLPDGDLRDIVRAITLARCAHRTVRTNLALAFGYNLVAIPLAAGACYLAFGTSLSPLIAAAATGLGTVSVILNALRLRIRRIA